MKLINRNAMVAAGILMLAAGATGCSVFKPVKTYEGSGKGLQGWIMSEQEDVKDDADKVSGKVKDMAESVEKNVGRAEEKTQKEVDNAMDKSVEETEVKKSQQNSAVLDGDWAIMEVLGKKAVGETPPCIKFVPSENRMYGNNGCNVMNATYKADYADGSLQFGNIATTMMMCGQTDITDVEVGQALGMTVRYTIDTADSDATMRLYDAAGKVVMTLMHRDFHFLDGTWKVVAIDGEKVDIDGMKLALDVDEKRMHGNTGCNIINGEFETDMDTANSISLSRICMTLME
ncbi:MAG: META domain-containing protein, partial [Muribaculaceae bacterium]|nr:META domain-containing protein [Muribaculaceae bacterium]